jgi:hypothetical protein
MPTTCASLSTTGMRCTLCFSMSTAASAGGGRQGRAGRGTCRQTTAATRGKKNQAWAQLRCWAPCSWPHICPARDAPAAQPERPTLDARGGLDRDGRGGHDVRHHGLQAGVGHARECGVGSGAGRQADGLVAGQPANTVHQEPKDGRAAGLMAAELVLVAGLPRAVRGCAGHCAGRAAHPGLALDVALCHHAHEAVGVINHRHAAHALLLRSHRHPRARQAGG